MKNLFAKILLAGALLFGAASARAESYGDINIRFHNASGPRGWYTQYGSGQAFNLTPPGVDINIKAYRWWRRGTHNKVAGIGVGGCDYADYLELKLDSTKNTSSSPSNDYLFITSTRLGSVMHISGGANGVNVDDYFMGWIVRTTTTCMWDNSQGAYYPVPNNGWAYYTTPFEFTVDPYGPSGPLKEWSFVLGDWSYRNDYWVLPHYSTPNVVCWGACEFPVSDHTQNTPAYTWNWLPPLP